MSLNGAPVCVLREIAYQDDFPCLGKNCAWFCEDYGTCAVSMIGEACGAAINADEGPLVGSRSRAGIIVKTAPLAGDFAEDDPGQES